MAYIDTIIAGFGGQGVMLIGNLLAYAGMHAGLNVTYIPVYGPEMRGGTSNCTVVLSDDEIGSPLIPCPKSLIIMNPPSLDKFQSQLEENGHLIVNSSLVDASKCDTKRFNVWTIDANAIADRLGNTRMANMVALGAFLKATGILTIEDASKALEFVISARYHNLIPANTVAIEAGFNEAVKL